MHPYLEQTLVAVLHKLEADGSPIPHNRWQRFLSKTLRALIPAWHQSPWMEWEFGTWVGTFAAYDEIGRQLGEANVLPEWRTTPLKDTWKPFKGPGIRQGHPYNIDAMHEMINCWDNLLQDALTLRKFYCQQYQRPNTHVLAASDLYVITLTAVSISSFLLRRDDSPTHDGALPRQAAAAFKVIGGMYAATNRMLSQAHPMLIQAELDSDLFMQYLEDEQLLLSPEMRACAGPVKMIRQMLSALIDPPTDQSLPNGLAYLGTDVERAFAYGAVCVRIDLAVLLYWRSLKHYLKPLLQHSETTIALREALLNEPELGMDDDIPLSAYITMAKQILASFAATELDQAFLAALPHQDEQSQTVNFKTIQSNCYQLETAMRPLAHHLQNLLNQTLQQKHPQLKENDWSPAPGSHFLKNLF